MAEDPAVQPPPAAAVPVNIRTAALSVLFVAACVAALRIAAPLVIPILISILLAYALQPAVSLLVRHRIPRLIAAVLVFGMLLGSVHAGGRALLSRADTFVRDVPAMIAEIKDELARRTRSTPGVLAPIRRAGEEVSKAAADVGPQVQSSARPVTIVRPPLKVTDVLLANEWMLAEMAGYAFAIALLTFLLLAAGDVLRRKILRLGGARFEARKVTAEVLKEIDGQIERYLVVRLLISTIVAVLTALVLWPIGLAHWVEWGVIAGVLNVLPFVGPSVAVAAIALAGFLQFKTLTALALAGGLSGLVAMLEGNLLTPWLTSRAGELNTVAVFVAILFWGWLWGIWGLILAVPILVAMKAAADHIEPFKPFGELLGR